jgi:hypothetical protein
MVQLHVNKATDSIKRQVTDLVTSMTERLVAAETHSFQYKYFQFEQKVSESVRLIQHEIRNINDNSETAAQEIRALQSSMGELCYNTRVDTLENEFGKISSANMEQITEARESA